MAPDLFQMIEYAASRDVRIGFNSNGMLLTRGRAERLIESGLDWLHISIDGATARTYEDIRARSDFERVCRNVSGLVETKRLLRAPKPVLAIVCVAMRGNVAELPALVHLVHELGVDKLWVQGLSHSFSDTDPAGDYQEIRVFSSRQALSPERAAEAEKYFAQAGAVADELGIGLRLPKLEPSPSGARPLGTPGCDWPWRAAYVNHDGKVQPCCMIMGSDRAVLGDASKENLAAIWRNERYAEFRQRLMSNQPPDVFRGCSSYKGVF